MTISVAADERSAEQMRRDAAETLGRDVEDNRLHVTVGRDPAPAIVDHSAALGSTVVCMSTRGRGRVAGTVIGSVTRAVLQKSKVPLIAVGPHADRPPALVGRPRRRPAGWPAPLSVRRLVTCVDGSPASEAVLPVAAAWAVALDMSLTVFTVAEDAQVPISGGPPPNRFGPVDPVRYVQELAARWTDVAPGAAGEVVTSAVSVPSGLSDHLAARPAGLVALTTHARSGRDRIRLGAVSADIVRTSTAPVLVVPLPDN
jgi:nucleotide-binding universal stress UspA family protein